MNVNNLINYYESRDLFNLATSLGNQEKRIEFEKWLINQQSVPNDSSNQDFSWHSRVISLLCKQLREDVSVDKTHEDYLIAKIISQTKPIAERINQTAEKILSPQGVNASLILSEIRNAALPLTSTVLLHTLLESQPLDKIIFWSIRFNNISMLQAIQKEYEKDFGEAIRNLMVGKMKEETNPLYFAIYFSNEELMEYMSKIAPDKFKIAMLDVHPANRSTLLQVAVDRGNEKIIELMSVVSPEEFKACMKMSNTLGQTPIQTAIRYNNQRIIELMAKTAPDEFKAEIPAIYGLLKSRNLTKRLEKVFNISVESEIKEINRAKVNRRAISHAFHIAGKTELVTNKGTHLVSVDLEGHHARQWLQIIYKNFEHFKTHYKDILSDSEFKVLQESLNLAANLNNIPMEILLQKIKDGFPVLLNAGYPGHEVTLLLWGNRFMICNRGEGSNSPIEIFQFDPHKLDVDDLKKIESTKYRGDKNSYQKLIFETLKNKLNFHQDERDLKLQKQSPLPRQTVGNCSFLSPITSIYGLILMMKSFEIDKEGRLTQPLPETEIQEKINEAISTYQTWLSFEQITILERNVKLNQKDKLGIQQDHNLIFGALAKAHLLPLDHYCQERLSALTSVYLNEIKDETYRNRVKTALLFLKTKPRIPLL